MSPRKLLIGFTALILSFPGMLSAEQMLTRLTFQDSTALIPLTGKVPVIDGKIHSDWKEYTQWSGFSTYKGERLLQSTKKGFVRVCSDGKNLYFGVRTITYNNSPGGGLTRLRSQRDGEVYRDDSVELIFYVKNQGYQIIANSLDAVYDMSFAPGGIVNKAWNCAGFRSASVITDGYWDLEMSVPLASIGNPEEFYLNVARNWIENGKINGTTLNSTPAYLNKAFMFKLALAKDGAYVRERDLGNVDQGQWRYRADVVNTTGNPLECKILLHHYYGNKSRKDQIRKFIVPPGKTLPVSLDADMNSTAVRNLSILVSDPGNSKRFFARKFAGKFSSLGHRPPTKIFTVKGQGLGQLFHYPGYKRVVVEFRSNPGIRYKEMALEIPGQKKTLFKLDRGVWSACGTVSGVKGKYPVYLVFTDPAGKTTRTLIHTLNVLALPWENNTLGKERIVLPPFNGVTLKAGNTVETLLIRRKLNTLGLYDSIVAEKKELLAGPMHFILKVNGKKILLKGGKPRYSQEKNKYSVVMENTAQGAEGIRLEVRNTFEYDNFHWMEITLKSPRPVKVEQLTLVIPFRDQEAKLYHSFVNEMRTFVGEKLPAGKGLLWDGTRLQRRIHRGMQVIHPQILPYLWLGTENTGLAYFIENTLGCKVDHKRNAARIYRENGVVRAELDFINVPVTLKKPRKIQFGLIPTPVKKVSRDMMRFFMDSEGRLLPGMIRSTFGYNHALGFFPDWGMRPFNDDYTFFTKCMESIRSGVPLDYKPLVKEWFKKYGKEYKALFYSLPGGVDKYKSSFSRYDWFRKQNLQHPNRGKSYSMIYTDPRLAFVADPDVEYYKSEWFNPAVMHYFATYRTSATPSYVDYMVYYYDKMLQHGAHGIYLDDLFIVPEPNEATMGLRDEEGELHPGNGILAMREMIRRIVTRMYLRKKTPIMLMAHMSCQLNVPVFTHVTSMLGFEQFGGDSAYPSRFSEDHIRTVYTGTKVGASVHTLRLMRIDPNKYKDPKARSAMWTYLNHTLLAMSLPFNIRSAFTQADEWIRVDGVLARFGIGDVGSCFVPYWEKEAAALQAKGMLVSSYRKKDRVLVVVSNYFGKTPVTASLKVDYKALGLPADAPCADALTGKKADLNKLDLKAYGYRLIWLGVMDQKNVKKK